MQRVGEFWRSGIVGKVVVVAGALGIFSVGCCALLLVISAFVSPQQASAPGQTAVVATAPTNPTPEPAPTLAPTNTPEPTGTPAPTATPASTETPTSIPPTATPVAPIVVSGNGAKVTDHLTVPYRIGSVKFKHTGRSNFAVKLYTAGNDRGDLLVNVIGNYEGTRLYTGDSPAFFEIDADGPWELVISPLTEDPTAIAVQGKGDWVTGLFVPTQAGAVPYHFTHTGERNFAVYLHCADDDDLLQNEIGTVDSEAVVRFGDGPCLWEIQADGDWTIAPK